MSSAALEFAKRVLATRGAIEDADVERVRRAGFGDGEIAEIVANVALGLFTNTFNNVARTSIDFPVVSAEL